MTEEFTASQLNEFASNIKLSKEKEHVYTLMRKAAEAAKYSICVNPISDKFAKILKDNGFYVNTCPLKETTISWKYIKEVIKEFTEGEDIKLSDPEKDYTLEGKLPAEQKVAVEGHAVALSNTELTGSVATLKADTTINILGGKIAGTYDRAKVGNAILKTDANDSIVIKDTVITPDKAYNCLEVSLSGNAPKNVLIENVRFEGHFTNNAISVFATKEDAVVTIRNCHFADVSNVLRLSNKTNAKCTFNIENCTVDKWETRDEYRGLVICQDYTSMGKENLFKKVTINITNVTGPNGKIVAKPMEEICGTKDENQLVYVYIDGHDSSEPYNEAIYPTINIK